MGHSTSLRATRSVARRASCLAAEHSWAVPINHRRFKLDEIGPIDRATGGREPSLSAEDNELASDPRCGAVSYEGQGREDDATSGSSPISRSRFRAATGRRWMPLARIAHEEVCPRSDLSPASGAAAPPALGLVSGGERLDWLEVAPGEVGDARASRPKSAGHRTRARSRPRVSSPQHGHPTRPVTASSSSTQ
jgi:hypothetical protein